MSAGPPDTPSSTPPAPDEVLAVRRERRLARVQHGRALWENLPPPLQALGWVAIGDIAARLGPGAGILKTVLTVVGQL